jgi:glycosyltransferase involved in cell wall biosynthesis
MKILWFTITPCGAAEKLNNDIYVAGWLASLERQIKINHGIDLSVCFYYTGKASHFEYKQVNYYPLIRGRSNSKLNKLINRINLFKTNYDLPYIYKLVEVIETVNPDIIHIHGCEENFGLIQNCTDIPIVISIQGLLNPYCEKFFSGIPFSAAIKYERLISKLLLNSFKNNYYLFSKWAERETIILKDAKFIIGRTHWDRRITRLLAPKSKYFIGNEIIRESFYRNKWDKQHFNSQIQIVTTMSMGLYKGLESVLKTAALLKDNGFNFEWIVIGQSDSDNYSEIIKRWLKKGYKENNIVLCGRKNESEVVKILCQSDIYCQVSHIENSPNSLCEAMLLGMPIVATLAGGTDSILENFKEGLLVQDGDSFSLAGTILELANDFSKSKQYGINARQTAILRHNPQRVANEIIGIYDEIYKSACK